MVRELRAGQGADPPAYVLAGDDWHPGVIGIVASRIAERVHRPTVLIALDGESGSGSGRSIPGFDLLAGLTAASDELERYGGHRAAAGCTIARNRVPAFREAFCAHAARELTPELLARRERIDAVVAGDALELGLAEELERLEPIGAGNPAVSLLVCAALCDDPRPMGEGRHLAFTLAAGGARSRCVSFGQGASLPAEPGRPVDAAVRLEVNRYNGAVEPRLVLRAVGVPAAGPIDVLGEPASFEEGVLAELDRELGPPSGPAPALGASAVGPPSPGGVAELAAARVRGRHDHRGRGIAGLIGELVATGEPVLVLAAHAGHRAQALHGRVGGFAVTSYAALGDRPALASEFPHVVALDPPAAAQLPRADGAGHLHLAWGGPELAFARRVHEWNYRLRAPLAEVYRGLRAAGTLSGPALEALLRGDGPQPRSAALAGRLVRVLSELGLARVDRTAGLALTVASAPARTELERSPAFRAYHVQCEDGLRWLTPVPDEEATRAA
jgi:single-stranded-DNA-specific exonuclease